MQQFLAQPLAQWVILFTATLILIAIGVYIVGRLRGSVAEEETDPSTQLTKFREMHDRGEVSDEEFREIKTQLATRMQARLNDSEQTG